MVGLNSLIVTRVSIKQIDRQTVNQIDVGTFAIVVWTDSDILLLFLLFFIIVIVRKSIQCCRHHFFYCHKLLLCVELRSVNKELLCSLAKRSQAFIKNCSVIVTMLLIVNVFIVIGDHNNINSK